MKNTMHPAHPEWARFKELLEERLREEGKEGSLVSGCKGGRNKDHALRILGTEFSDLAPLDTVALFEQFGGYCDCEILMNVEAGWRSSTPDDVIRVHDMLKHQVGNLLAAVEKFDAPGAARALLPVSSLVGNYRITVERCAMREEAIG